MSFSKLEIEENLLLKPPKCNCWTQSVFPQTYQRANEDKTENMLKGNSAKIESNLRTANGDQMPLSWRVKHTWNRVGTKTILLSIHEYQSTPGKGSNIWELLLQHHVLLLSYNPFKLMEDDIQIELFWESPCGQSSAQVGLVRLFRDHPPNFLIQHTPTNLCCADCWN